MKRSHTATERVRSGQGGFTLIELLVVVLILGILMAIAIPTFLRLTSGAKTGAAEADLTTAAQDEATYYTLNGSYDAVASPDSVNPGKDNINAKGPPIGMLGLDPGINWTWGSPTAAAGTKSVSVVFPSPTIYSTIDLGTVGSDGYLYWVQASNGALSYARTTTAVTTVPVIGDFLAGGWKSLPASVPTT